MKSMCSTGVRRVVLLGGLLVGFGLLSAGVASADDGDSPGLLGGVAELVAPVSEVIAPVTREVSAVTTPVLREAEPVLAPVNAVAQPLLEPLNAVLDPVVAPVVQTVEPVLAPLQPAVGPLLTPVVKAVPNVPVVARAAEPLVTSPSAPAEVAPVAPPVSTPDTAVPVEAKVPTSAWAEPVVVAAKLPQQQRQPSAPDVAPLKSAPTGPAPDMPFVLSGMTGTAASGGSASSLTAVLPARQGPGPHGASLPVVRGDQVHGSWCYYYGRSHPS